MIDSDDFTLNQSQPNLIEISLNSRNNSAFRPPHGSPRCYTGLYNAAFIKSQVIVAQAYRDTAHDHNSVKEMHFFSDDSLYDLGMRYYETRMRTKLVADEGMCDILTSMMII